MPTRPRHTNGPPRFPLAGLLLTVPFQATVKSLSSPLHHHLDTALIEWLPSLVEMTSICERCTDLA